MILRLGLPGFWNCCRCAGFTVQQIGEESLVVFAGKEAWKLASKPVGEAFREFRIAVVFKTVKHQRADEDFTASVSGTILLCQPCLESLGTGFKLGNLLFNGFASHGFPRFCRDRRQWRFDMPCPASPVGNSGIGNALRHPLAAV
ncbi:Hypothetical protein APM_2855 (plasmid) [Acidiphilium sp. PM]|nr:Hypothetical protein APM_2855 [Acidiphilium sp. PM]